MKISGCIIARDEEMNIGKCIESMRSVCDEVILVDTGSIDKTVEIAQSLGAKIYTFTWIDDFSAAKNYAIDKANGDWILFLDADEYLENVNRSFYEELIVSCKNFDAIICEIFNISDKNENNVFHSHIGIRLFGNKKNIRYKGRIHENLFNKDKNINAINASKYFKIFHTGYIKEQMKAKNKFQRNLNLLFKELESKPNDPELYYYIADTYGVNADFDMQIKYAKRSIECGKINMIGFEEEPHILLIRTMLNSKKDTDIIFPEIQSAIYEFPESPIFRYYLSVIYLREKKYSLCEETILMSLQLNESYKCFSVNHMRIHMMDIYRVLGYINQIKLNNVNAVKYYTQALQLNNKQKDALQNLIWLLRDENAEDVILFLNKIYKISFKEDLELLIEALAGSINPILLAYYEKKLFQLTGEGNNAVLLSLLKLKQYKKVYEYSYNIYIETRRDDVQLLLFVSALFLDDSEALNSIIDLVNSTMEKIIKYFSKQKVHLNQSDLNVYLEILNEFIRIGDNDKINILVRMAEEFDLNVYANISEVFYSNNMYERCINNGIYALNEKSGLNDKLTFKLIGLSYYYLNDFFNAINYFYRYLEIEKNDFEVFEYLLFIYSKVNEDIKASVKNKLMSISTSSYLSKFM